MSGPALRLLRDSVTRKWSRGSLASLPDFYKDWRMELAMRPETPVHWVKDNREFKAGPNPGAAALPVQNFPIPALYPVESNRALWGGEGVVKGYRKKKKMGFRCPRVWMPYIRKSVLYSEILDQHFLIRVTLTTMDLIDKAEGFDNYILQTHEGDLKSALGMKLKREMMRALHDRTTYTDDPAEQERIYKKYQEYLIPRDQVDWLGLSEEEALEKQAGIESKSRRAKIVPLKDVYADLYLRNLRDPSGKGDGSEVPANEEREESTASASPFKSVFSKWIPGRK